jgi:hypothetical protein
VFCLGIGLTVGLSDADILAGQRIFVVPEPLVEEGGADGISVATTASHTGIFEQWGADKGSDNPFPNHLL